MSKQAKDENDGERLLPAAPVKGPRHASFPDAVASPHGAARLSVPPPGGCSRGTRYSLLFWMRAS